MISGHCKGKGRHSDAQACHSHAQGRHSHEDGNLDYRLRGKDGWGWQ
jgi:hypothetical protein